MSVPNFKQIALFVRKLLGGPKFRPAADTLPGGTGWPKFNQLEMVTTFTYKPSQFGEDRCTQFELLWPHIQTHKQTQTGPITIRYGMV